MDNNNNNNDPKRIGPGVWYTLQTQAKSAMTDIEKTIFIKNFRKLIEEFPCLDCRGHAIKYIQANPPEDFWTVIYDGKDVGLSKYISMFHNSVNQRLGKPILSWETVYSMYYDNIEVCSHTCGEPDINTDLNVSVSMNDNIIVSKGNNNNNNNNNIIIAKNKFSSKY